MVAIILLLLLLFVLIQTPWVQTQLAQRGAEWLSAELNTVISIGSLSLRFPDKLSIKSLYVEDQEGDTLIYVRELDLNGLRYSFNTGNIHLGTLKLEDPVFYLHRHHSDSLLNLRFLSAYFAVSDSSTSPSTPVITCRKLELNNGKFQYHNFLGSPYDSGLVDFSSLSIDRFFLHSDTVKVVQDSVSTGIRYLSFRDHSGFSIEELSGLARVSGSGIQLDSAFVTTPLSRIEGDLRFKTKTYGEWNSFVRKVNMDHRLKSSRVHFRDLRYFVSGFEGLDRGVDIRGSIRGPVAKLRGRDVFLEWDDHSHFLGDFRLEGLPVLEETFITLDIKRLTTNKAEVDRIPLPPFTDQKYVRTPDNISRLGQIEFSGNFTGFLNDFVAYGKLDTRLGRVRSDIAISEDESGQYVYVGDLATEEFDLGRFYDEPLLGQVSSALKVDGSGLTVEDVQAEMTGEVTSFWFNDYNYHGISVNGNLRKAFFDGALTIRDEHIWLDFLGTVDFSSKVPEIKATASVEDLDPVALNFLEDSVYTAITADLIIDGKGLDLETITGSASISDFSYCHGSDEYDLKRIDLDARNTPGGRDIRIKSPILDATIFGTYNISGIQKSVYQIIDELFPSYILPTYVPEENQDFSLKVTVNDFSPVTELFLPQISIAEGTKISLNFNEPEQRFKLTSTSSEIRLENSYVRGMVLDIQRPAELAYITLISDTIQLTDSLYMASFALDARSENDTIYSTVTWDSSSQLHSGDISSRLILRGNENFDIHFEKSSLTLNQLEWNIRKDGFLSIDSSRVAVERIAFEHEQQFLKVNGVVSREAQDQLDFDINGFDLALVNPFLADAKVQLAGRVEGEASLRDVYAEKRFLSDLLINDFAVNNTFFGKLCIESSWDQPGKRLVLAGEIQDNMEFPLIFSGYYTPSNKLSPLDIKLELDAFALEFINPFLTEGISQLSGTVDADTRVTGTFEAPELEGSIQFNQVGVTIDYLNTTYYLNDRAGIYPGMFTLDYVTVKDQEGNRGKLIGTVVHENFNDWNYDVYVALEEGRFLAMNTTKELNPLYYGKAYASGFVSIFGYDNNLEFDINLKAERGTVINMPLGEPEEQKFENFIVFVNTGEIQEEEELDLSGIDMHFELEITPDAEFRLIFDEAAGDIMRGRGTGTVNMDITSEGKFEMYGTLEVYEGNYLFTLRNLINKEFTVQRGGTISWFGDPLGADLNLRTLYKLNAPLYDLLGQSSEQYRNRVPVDLIMNLKGKMLNPEIAFEVELPSSDELTRSRVRSALSTEEELNKQAFALLVLKRFLPPPNVQGAGNSFGVAENSMEFLTSQFNSWLSQISEDFDIGLNYRPGDEITNSEVALALSTQLFNERMRLRGNFGVNYGSASQANQNPSNLVGDVEIEYDITKDGKLRMVVFNRTNEYDVTQINRSLTTQGLGVVYQEEFDTAEEFFCRVKQLFTKPEDREPCP